VATPLQVLHHGPEGEVRRTRFLWMVFSEPMVALGTPPPRPPARIEPEVPGHWRWAGPRTLLFEALPRFPGASNFEVEVDGAVSLSGHGLEAPVRWAFSTAPVRLDRLWPDGRLCPSAGLFVFGADQRIDPAEVLSRMELRVSGRSRRLVPALDEEVQAFEQAWRQFCDYPEDQRLAVKARTPLPARRRVTLILRDGPSLEGPRRWSEPQLEELTVPGPLRLVQATCTGGMVSHMEGPAQAWLGLEFDRNLDWQPGLMERILVEPGAGTWPLEGHGRHWTFHVDPRNPEYRVTLPADLQDQLGVTLGREIQLTVQTPTLEPVVFDGRDGWNHRGLGIPLADLEGLPLVGINPPPVEVEVRPVGLRDWAPVSASGSLDPSVAPGTPVLVQVQPPETPWNVPTPLLLDTSAVAGHRLVQVRWDRSDETPRRGFRYPDPVWIQPTDLGISVRPGPDGLFVWITSLADGRPLEGVETWSTPFAGMDESPPDGAARTDADGLAFLAYRDRSTPPRAVVARRGQDLAFLPESAYTKRSEWSGCREARRLLWSLFDDRGMYRPGEEAVIRGWLRVGKVEGGPAALPHDLASEVHYRIGSGPTLARGRLPLDEHGGFHLRWTLPESLEPQELTVFFEAKVTGDILQSSKARIHTLQVACFVRPEFRVEFSSAVPIFREEELPLECQARYYSGGALRETPVFWHLLAWPTAFQPPGWRGFNFGVASSEKQLSRLDHGLTDETGRHSWLFRFEPGLAPDQALEVQATARVQDKNLYPQSCARRMVLHPSSVVLGVRLRRRFLESGESLEFETVVTDLEGRPAAGLDVRARLLCVKGEGQVEVSTRHFRSSTRPEPLCLPCPDSGEFRLVLEAEDGQGRCARTSVPLWVLGPALGLPHPDSSPVSLEPDLERYQPGEVARLLVLSPVHPASGLLTLIGGGAVECRPFRLEGPWTTLEIPITQEHIPGLVASVELVRLGERGPRLVADLADPDRATGTFLLAVDPGSERLQVEVRADQALVDPGAEVNVHVQVLDAQGHPVEGAQVALVAVDQAVTDLAGHGLPEPVAGFRTLPLPLDRWGTDRDRSGPVSLPAFPSLRDHLLRIEPSRLVPSMSPTIFYDTVKPSDELKEAQRQAQASLRRCFRPLAAFEPGLVTDGDGRLRWTFRLPDDLTRWRVFAVACLGARGGAGEVAVTSHRPLTVRPSPPRFLRVGDRPKPSVLVHNHGGSEADVLVKCQVEGGRLVDPNRSVLVGPGERGLVRVPLEATTPGDLVLRVQIEGDGAEVRIPCRPALSSRVQASSGWFAGRERVDLALPETAVGGRLRLVLSARLEGDLVRAVRRLLGAHWPATEPSASRLLALCALLASPLRSRFPGRLKRQMKRRLEADLRRLQERADRGFPMWPYSQPDPYLALFVGRAVVEVARAGLQVPERLRSAVLEGLRAGLVDPPIPEGESVALPCAKYRDRPVSWTLAARRAWHAGAARVLRLLGEEAPLPPLEGPPQTLEEAAWRLASGEAPMLQEALNRLEVLDAEARTTQLPGLLEDFVWSPRRGPALLLEALPGDSPLVPRLASGLLGGLDSPTHDLAWALAGLACASRCLEHPVPEGEVKLKLGRRHLRTSSSGHGWRGAWTLPIPEGEELALCLSRSGPGGLFYRSELRWDEPPDGALPLDEGLALQRRYEGADRPEDALQTEDGTWHLAAGARIRVHLTVLCPARRSHLVLVDPLPAGLEIEDLKGRESVQTLDILTDAAPCRFQWRWASHFRFFDDRVKVYAERLAEGAYTFSYVAVARTAGEFQAPPTTAEEMYRPEVRARTGWDRVAIRGGPAGPAERMRVRASFKYFEGNDAISIYLDGLPDFKMEEADWESLAGGWFGLAVIVDGQGRHWKYEIVRLADYYREGALDLPEDFEEPPHLLEIDQAPGRLFTLPRLIEWIHDHLDSLPEECRSPGVHYIG